MFSMLQTPEEVWETFRLLEEGSIKVRFVTASKVSLVYAHMCDLAASEVRKKTIGDRVKFQLRQNSWVISSDFA